MPIWMQLFVLGTVVNIMFSSADIICVLLADKVSLWLRHSKASGQLLQRIGGVILVALGLNLAFSQR